jgi:uncharacterized membrane protein
LEHVTAEELHIRRLVFLLDENTDGPAVMFRHTEFGAAGGVPDTTVQQWGDHRLELRQDAAELPPPADVVDGDVQGGRAQAVRAQVPDSLAKNLPVSTDDIVLGTGIIEIGLGAALAGLPKERLRIGAAVAAYFVAIFPGNISQLLKHADAFGLDSDRKRTGRLLFQPVFVRWLLFARGVL